MKSQTSRRRIDCVILDALRPYWKRLPSHLHVRWCGDRPEELDAAVSDDVEVLVTDPMPRPSAPCKGLRFVQLLSAGTDQLSGHPLMQKSGIRAANAAGVCGVHIAEFVVGRLLAHVRSFRDFDRYQSERQWPDRIRHAAGTLRGKRVVIVGYGGVGREIARMLSTLGVATIAVTSDGERKPYRGFLYAPGTGDPDGSIPSEVVASTRLGEAVADADALVLTVPLSDQTRKLVSARVLDRMKPTSILINVSRGAVVETAALVAALDAGKLAHAYLDVFEQEPLPQESALWAHPKVSITPHIAGVMADAELVLEQLFLENLRRHETGEPLLNELDLRRFAKP